jgi:hypothetical protein
MKDLPANNSIVEKTFQAIDTLEAGFRAGPVAPVGLPAYRIPILSAGLRPGSFRTKGTAASPRAALIR